MSDQSTLTTDSNNNTLFPYRLFTMLEECEAQGKSHIVSWLPDGQQFKVHMVPEFVETILPKFFRQSKYKSYQRQLNLWGFERVTTNGPEKGAYYHPKFLKGQLSMVKLLTRQRGNKTDGPFHSSNAKSSMKLKSIPPKRSSLVAKDSPSSKPQEKATLVTGATFKSPMWELRESAVITPPLSPSDFPKIGIQGNDAEYALSILPEKKLHFEGCEFFPLEEECFDELADILLETGFLEQEQQHSASPRSVVASHSKMCKV